MSNRSATMPTAPEEDLLIVFDSKQFMYIIRCAMMREICMSRYTRLSSRFCSVIETCERSERVST